MDVLYGANSGCKALHSHPHNTHYSVPEGIISHQNYKCLFNLEFGKWIFSLDGLECVSHKILLECLCINLEPLFTSVVFILLIFIFCLAFHFSNADSDDLAVSERHHQSKSLKMYLLLINANYVSRKLMKAIMFYSN